MSRDQVTACRVTPWVVWARVLLSTERFHSCRKLVISLLITVATSVALTAPAQAQRTTSFVVPGDCNLDGLQDFTDAICLLGFLFLGQPSKLPCGNGSNSDPASKVMFDWTGENEVDLSDAIALLRFAFLGGAPHPLGADPIYINGCGSIGSNTWDVVWTQTLGDSSQGDQGDQEPPCDGGADCVSLVGPVMQHSGEVRLPMALPTSSIPGRGDVMWNAIIRYRSGISFDGCVGRNINVSGLTDRLTRLPSGDYRLFDGGQARFDDYGATTGTAPGNFRALRENADGTVTIRLANGNRATYAAFDGSSAAGALVDIQDPNGNTVTYERDENGVLNRAIDTMGRAIDYEYDELSRVTRIVDFHRRTTTLGYNDSNQLVEIVLPAVTGTPNDDDGIASNGSSGNDFPDGATFRLRYDTDNSDPNLADNLLGVQYPNEVATGGPERYSFTYGQDPTDRETYDRCIAIDVGGGRVKSHPVNDPPVVEVPAGGTYSFTYRDFDSSQSVVRWGSC